MMRWCLLFFLALSGPLGGPALAQSKPAQARPAPPAADAIASVGHPGWTVDAGNGCWIWNPNPQQEETVRWSGACPEGPAQGEGVLVWHYQRDGEPGEDRVLGTGHTTFTGSVLGGGVLRTTEREIPAQ
jgi:hypothetical protein